MKSTRLILPALGVLASRPDTQAQTTLDLGSAASYALLSGSSLTVAGPADTTDVAGDIGSPAITGLGNVNLTGTNQADNSFTQNALSAVSAAYNTGVGLAASAGDSGETAFANGTVLTPGVYHAATTLSLSGTITLSGAGAYIFQIGTTLGTSAGTQILLTNGAEASDVSWVVGSSATLGDASTFVGNVLAATAISMGVDSTVNGGLFAENGALTVDGNDSVSSAVPEPANSALLMAAFAGLLAGAQGSSRARRAKRTAGVRSVIRSD